MSGGVAYEMTAQTWYVEDTEVDLEAYFVDAYALFTERLRRFYEMRRVPNLEEEQELRFMLEVLVDTKRFLENERK